MIDPNTKTSNRGVLVPEKRAVNPEAMTPIQLGQNKDFFFKK
jgi:hypothetical protein